MNKDCNNTTDSSVLHLRCAPVECVRIGFVGLGVRAKRAVHRMMHIDGCKIVALCDLVQENIEDAEKMKSEYEEKLADVQKESEEILRSTYRKAQLREEEIIKEARTQAARIVERSNEQAELEKKRALNEVKDEVSHMAISIASALIEKDLSENEHKEMIDSFINEIGEQK